MVTKFEYSENDGVKLSASVKFSFSRSNKKLSPDDYKIILEAAKNIKEVFTRLKKEIK